MVGALAEGHGYIVQFLSDHGVDTNRPNNDGLTSLHLASQGAHDHTVHLLFGRGAELNRPNGDGSTSL